MSNDVNRFEKVVTAICKTHVYYYIVPGNIVLTLSRFDLKSMNNVAKYKCQYLDII